MQIVAIDPGTTDSAWVIWNGGGLVSFGKESNEHLLGRLRTLGEGQHMSCVVEQVCSYGMTVGFATFETVWWSGRFAEAFGADRVDRIPRMTVKMHLCHDSRAKDSNIRLALIDRFGPPGTKKWPGILYGVHGDVWAALALAVTWWDLHHADN